MRINEIFIDLDDTLNKFTMHALRYVGCFINWKNPLSNYNPAWGFDIIKAANTLHPHRKFTPKQFWESFSRYFWANLPRSDEFDFLLEKSIELVGKDNICILSCPMDDPACVAGKLKWIQEFCPSWMHRQYLLGPEKFRCAKPGALLIDDSDENVEKFFIKGGQTILVPRPWNSRHKEDTMKHLTSLFRYFKSQE